MPRSSAAGCLRGVICAGSKSIEHVCGAFGLTAGPEASIIPVSRGAMGRVWCLDLGAERYAVKELFWESDEESVRPEVTFTAHLDSPVMSSRATPARSWKAYTPDLNRCGWTCSAASS